MEGGRSGFRFVAGPEKTAAGLQGDSLDSCCSDRGDCAALEPIAERGVFSIGSAEMKELVEETGRAWESLGKAYIGPTEAERSSITFRRSLYIVKDLKAGDILTKENVRAIRPGLGLPPKHLNQILGKIIKGDVSKGTPLDSKILKT